MNEHVTDFSNLVFDEFGMVVEIKNDPTPIEVYEKLAKVFDKPDCIITHIGHKQDYSIVPKIRRRRPRWHKSKKQK